MYIMVSLSRNTRDFWTQLIFNHYPPSQFGQELIWP